MPEIHRFNRQIAVATSATLVAACLSCVLVSAASAAELQATTAIEALQQVKNSLSPIEHKQSMQLVLAKRLRQDAGIQKALPRYRTNLPKDESDLIVVDITGADSSPELLAAIHEVRGTVLHSSPSRNTLHVKIPLGSIDRIAQRPDVTRIAVAPEMTTAAVSSEGDVTHGAASARQRYSTDGHGVKACVISDGINSLQRSQNAGELPAVEVLPGQEGVGDEGTAMLEIVHDLAPGATLGFATAVNGEDSLADNIRALRRQLHCDVIVDDVRYYDESPFQDGPVAQAVNDVTADGGLYFSSAGNEGNAQAGTSGHWEGDFVDSGRGISGTFGRAHDFAPGSAVQVSNPVSKGSLGKPVTLFWSDPLGKATNDFDVYVLDPSGNVVSAGLEKQDGTQDPFEITNIPYADNSSFAHPAPYFVAVVRYSGSGKRYLSLTANRGRFITSDNLKGYSTAGVTAGHSAAAGAISVAAAPAGPALGRPLEQGDPANPAGPYPAPFTKDTVAERFSSDGPRRMFYQADGKPYTAGNSTSSGGTVRAKPDLTAADGVVTSVPGFERFFGTSAAAPHAAAIAALLLSAKPGATPEEIRRALTTSATDIGPAGYDAVAGNGITMAEAALRALGAVTTTH